MDIKYIKNISGGDLTIEGVLFTDTEKQDVYYDTTIFGNRAGDVCEYYTRDMIELYDEDDVLISDQQTGFDLITKTANAVADGTSESGGPSATKLSDLTDVDFVSLVEGQAMVHNEVDDVWENTDAEPVEITTPAEGDVIKYVNGEWVNAPGEASSSSSTNMRYMKYFSTGTQLPAWSDQSPLMTDIYGNPCSLNGGYQNDMTAVAGASFTAFPITKVLVSLTVRPYNINAGSPAPLGSDVAFTIHLVRTNATNRTVHEEVDVTITTLEALNQNTGQAQANYSTITFEHTLESQIPANSFIGPSITVPTTWGVIGNMFLTISYQET